jgi:hypothetical protein
VASPELPRGVPLPARILGSSDAPGGAAAGGSSSAAHEQGPSAIDPQARHVEAISELIARDRNRASVVAWSIANEPDSEAAAAGPYFKHLAVSPDHFRLLQVAD